MCNSRRRLLTINMRNSRTFGLAAALFGAAVLVHCESLANSKTMQAVTGCPPYQTEVAFPSVRWIDGLDPFLLDKLYTKVKEDFEETGVELDEVANGFRAKGIELKKDVGPEGNTKELIVSLDGDIAFATGSSRLTPKAKELVSKLGAAMLEYKDTLAKIGGHTDSVGTFASNIKLSFRRAEAVKKELIENMGIVEKRIIEVEGFADTQKVVDTNGPEVRNRRVEIRLTPGKVTIEEPPGEASFLERTRPCA